MTRRRFPWNGWLAAGAVLLCGSTVSAQGRQEPGRPIGTVSTQGNLIVLTLDDRALGESRMFDLAKRTLRFTPDGSGYRAENLPLQWDGDFGPELAGSQAPLHNFAFPFSGKNWDALSVGVTGSIAFGAPAGGGRGGRGGGVSIERFAQLQEAARTLLNTAPAICVFFKPRMSGTRYLKELADRAVITWDLTEPYAGIQDFTWVPTVNRFQAVLRKDGTIEMSYSEVAAKDAIVGVYPMVTAGAERDLASIAGAPHATAEASKPAPAYLDLRSVKLAAVDGLFLKVTLETRGPILPAGDPGAAGVQYKVSFNAGPAGRPGVVWTIRGGPQGRGGRGGGPRYVASGRGVSPAVKVDGNTISMQGILPAPPSGAAQMAVSADAAEGGAEPQSRIAPHSVPLQGLHSPEVQLTSVKREDGPFPAIYESFHYLSLPNPRDLTCSVIKALGDKFDFLVYYSDFRVDNQEAGTPSTGPLGGHVTGIGQTERGVASYCSEGRFQWQFVQPVYAGSNQMQEYPPEGVSASNSHNIGYYVHQLAERYDNKIPAYDYGMSQIGHELGHRWSAFVSAKVNGETIPLGPTHWATGLQAPVAFPFQRPVEASAMGGGVWQDNYDGTYTQLDDDYYVPATGYSYLDLYLMGLIAPAEVPDFFILRNLSAVGTDPNGHRIFKADRTKVTIQDVIAVNGQRLPAVDQSQKAFNTGIVVVTEHGSKPSKELIERADGIRRQWMEYWSITTGHRSTMTTNSK
jgi:hypothetical protein